MDLKTYINECKKHWRWFAATLATALIAAILFLLMFAPRYERSATVLIRVEFYSNLCNPQHKNYEHSYKPDYQKFIVMIRFLNHFFFFIFINIIFHFSTSFLLSLF